MKKGILAAALLALAGWTLWGNTALQLNVHTVQSERLPATFAGFRIAQISDLHNTENEALLPLLREANPDIIVITGDMIDSRKTDVDVALRFAEKAVEIAPCYYVSGNHEARVSEYEDLKTGLAALGVELLENEGVTLERAGETIRLLGVDDPSFTTDYLLGDSAEIMESALQTLKGEGGTLTVLLSHRPELFEVYVRNEIDLVFSGHAHGGQFRLPFVGGLVAPNQGLFPEYDAGIYTSGTTHMAVSRGIGNSIIPLRFNNRPEVVLVELSR